MSIPVQIDYFSDVLCVWAYLAQRKLEKLNAEFSGKVKINYHYITLFGDNQSKIEEGWRDRGGYQGFNQHVFNVVQQFPEIQADPQTCLHPDIWLKTCPKTSANAHLFLKSVSLWMERQKEMEISKKQNLFQEIDWVIKKAFFNQAIDVAQMNELFKIADIFKLPFDELKNSINDGSAMAALCVDLQKKEHLKLEGSPTFLMNQGRQKLYGNLSYEVLAANVESLLTDQ